MKIYQATITDLEGVSDLFNLYRIFYNQPSDPNGMIYMYMRNQEDKV